MQFKQVDQRCCAANRKRSAPSEESSVLTIKVSAKLFEEALADCMRLSPEKFCRLCRSGGRQTRQQCGIQPLVNGALQV